MSLGNYKALLFDCYGTLVDWSGGMKPCLTPLTTSGKDMSVVYETLRVNKKRLQSQMPIVPYTEAQSYLDTAKELGIEASEGDAKTFGESIPSWPAFPDSPESLRRLSEMGLKLVVLSNVDNKSFRETRKLLEHNVTLDAAYTAEDIGSYKPSQNNFDYAVSHIKQEFGIEQDEILIVACSKFHDIAPGQARGMKGAWIRRKEANISLRLADDIHPDWTFDNMAEFTDAMAKERATN